jgi:hypothetical protein
MAPAKPTTKPFETPAASPLDALLESAVFEDKRVYSESRDAIVVPPAYQTLVEKAYAEGKRVVLPITDKATFDQVANVLRAAGDRAEPKLSVQCKSLFDGEGDDAVLTGMRVVVGPRRGTRSKKSVDDTAAE